MRNLILIGVLATFSFIQGSAKEYIFDMTKTTVDLEEFNSEHSEDNEVSIEKSGTGSAFWDSGETHLKVSKNIQLFFRSKSSPIEKIVFIYKSGYGMETVGKIRIWDGGGVYSESAALGTWTGSASYINMQLMPSDDGYNDYAYITSIYITTASSVEQCENVATAMSKEEGTKVKIACDLTAVYQQGERLYATDGNTNLLITGELNHSYINGDKIGAGIEGVLSITDGMLSLTADKTTFSSPVHDKEIAPTVITLDEINRAKIHDFVTIYYLSTTLNNEVYSLNENESSIDVLNLFNIDLTEALTDRYIYYGFVGSRTNDAGETEKLLIPIKTEIDIVTAVNGIETNSDIEIAINNGYINILNTNRTVEIFDTNGKLIAADANHVKCTPGVYIVKSNGMTKKVVVK